ncbi:hypothetical protein B0H12DRAFT_1117635 [Mycena haematopus]|nr:hypothetical protein B0H12DRAFT_1117635 [Mycena haematopus]
MFDQDARWPSAPSSSPPSSPTAYNDSSPASSPRPDYANDEYGGEMSRASPPVDPFAASAKKSWIPPEYEKGVKKNRRASPSSPSRGRSKKPRLIGPESSLETVVAFPPRVSVPETDEEKEAAIWEAAITQMFNNVNGTIKLENSNLTCFPDKFIRDLSCFVAPDKEVETIPLSAFTPSLQRIYSRSVTAPAVFSRVPDSTTGSSRQDIQLYLAGNQIARLPISLSCLDKMTVLSLRNNKLKALPPEICRLPNLHTLNVSGNLLQHLPAGMLDMRLKVLNLFPNPFIEHPFERATSSRRRQKSQGRVAVSSTSRTPGRIPSLVELCLRSLFSTVSADTTDSVDTIDSADTTNHAEWRIDKYYEIPLCETDIRLSRSSKIEFRQVIPPHIRGILHAIHPDSVDAGVINDDPPSLGVCSSPLHHASVFVTPAEERYTWETVVAGVSVGGSVPLKWRGCLYGCLDFLGAEVEMEPPSQAVVPTDEEQEAVTRLQIDGLRADDYGDEG